MMSLLLSEEQTMLRDAVRSFLVENAPVAQLRQLRDSRDPAGFAGGTWSAFCDLGYAGVGVPEAHGGAGLGAVEMGVLMGQIGRNLSALPFLSSSVVAARLLQAAGSDAQQAQWLPRIASGEAIATLALDEGPKHKPEAVALRAERRADGWHLSGSKSFVPDGHVASLLLVAARTDDRLALFAVPRDTPGVTVERTAMADAHNAARVLLQDVGLPDAARLSAGGEVALQQTLDYGCAAAAAELLGIADEVFERTLDYLKQRKQFGKPIGECQALQHRAATLYVDLELARAALAKALHALDSAPHQAAEAVAIAKAKCGTTATLAVQEGVQMHGGMGMTDQLDFGLFMKRARVLQELYGDAGYHMDRLARMRDY
jgi:alkylation response protein AidB-like acyl-CoA dehydrogenase